MDGTRLTVLTFKCKGSNSQKKKKNAKDLCSRLLIAIALDLDPLIFGWLGPNPILFEMFYY